jgi:hypothetical protein
MIAVSCACSYTTKVPDQFAGKTTKCPKCGGMIEIGEPGTASFTPAPATPPTSQTKPKFEPIPFLEPPTTEAAPAPSGPARETCPSCNTMLTPNEKICMTCGWDRAMKQRTCVKCRMPVDINDGPGFGAFQGMFVGVGGFLIFFFFGWWLGLVAMSGLASLSGFSAVLMMAYRCNVCSERAKKLNKDEVSSIRKRRLAFLIGAILLGLTSIGLFFAGIALWKMSLSR